MTSPIFFDASGKRRRLVGRIVGLLLGLALIGALVFAATLVAVPTEKPLVLGRERQQPLPFLSHVNRLRGQFPRLKPTGARGQPVRIGFYVPWDPDSAASLDRNYNALDWVIAADAQVELPSGKLNFTDDAKIKSINHSHTNPPFFLLMVQNIAHEKWDGEGMARLLADRRKSEALIDQTIAAVKTLGWNGACFDIENMPSSALPAYEAMLSRAHDKFARAGIALTMTVPAGEPDWKLDRFAAAVDDVIFMDYDDHWQGGTPGPIASQAWFNEQLAIARRDIPATKLIVAIGSYGYDWHDGTADAMTIAEAWQEARDSEAMPTFDPVSGNSGFAFEETNESGTHNHTVWMMDAATNWNQLVQLQGIKGVALWRLGSEDPHFWEALAASRNGKRPALETIPASDGTDIEGSGEILRVEAEPRGGSRDIVWGANGTIANETYKVLPSPYVVRRTGAENPKKIALTFDDGPDPAYTPKLLDILEAKKAPAAFFVIGENVLEHPGIVRRIAADGFELGNHSFTHPNLAQETDLGTRLELNATQRLIESYTGRSMRLFRAPYFGDAEPSTSDELRPALLAQQRGYTIVGLHVDPGDWKTPGADQIAQKTIAQIEAGTEAHSANIVLLHDGGGNREQTVAALPQIIDGLRARGYELVSVAELAGLSHDAVMPVITGSDKAAVDADVGIFLGLGAIGYGIRWLFFFAIALGIARAVFMTTLALLDRKANKAQFTDAAQPPVSVIIPAYNEEAVIVSSIQTVLASDYPALEIIVADDGSKDATSARVAEHFGKDPRVRLLTMTNGGKASAINRALGHASGEIIISLDADTQFLTDTISKLVRWFVDPKIGAVAGNARVGNQVNLATRWQAIEYVTAQNVERRALDSLRAITVVPGAVGAWRRAALDAVGGYPEDTLAEDQDLTIAIQERGWRVAYDVEAVALTEAPETFKALGKQRFRWSFGTLQCRWKHRGVLRRGRPRGLAWFGMPQAWLFQIVFAAISPVIDLALAVSIIMTGVRVFQHGWAQTQSDVLRMLVYWIVFVGIDLLAGWIAYRLEPVRQRFPGFLMVMQRFYYRQLMYGIVLRSIAAALRGRHVGWGKLERTGSVSGAG